MVDEYFEELQELSDYRGTKPVERLKGLTDFFSDVEGLKDVRRYKIMESDEVKDSSAEHSWSLGVLEDIAYEMLDLDLNRERVEKIARYHDLAESLTDDYDSLRVENGDGITHDEKVEEEKIAIKKIARKLGGSEGHAIVEIWRDYENERCEEAKYVKAIDKMESMLHLAEREEFDEPGFIATRADEAVENFPGLEPVLGLVKQEVKVKFEKQGIEWKDEYNYGLEDINL